MADLLRATCRDCGTSFVSAHQSRHDALVRDPGLALRESCPHCGGHRLYRAADYHRGALVGPQRPLARSDS